MATCSANDLLSASKCFGDWGEQQLLRGMVTLLCKIWQGQNPMAVCDPNSLLAASACMGGMSTQQLLRIIVQLNCELLSGGSIAGTCLTQSAALRVAPSLCDVAINVVTEPTSPDYGTFQWWDTTSGQWNIFLRGL